MKKVPLIFSLLIFGCSAPKQVVSTQTDFSKYQQPYRIFSIGAWNHGNVVLTLTDAKDTYFIIAAPYSASLKRGDVYVPSNN